ncbi:outer membrane factor lipoprotein domain-containing protein [Chitinimonas naiadis]
MRHIPLSLSLLAALVLSACAGMGNSTTHGKPLNGENLAGGQVLTANPQARWPQEQWWNALGDGQLNQLVDEAMASSPSLAAAQARIERSRALAGLTEANSGPQLSLGADATRQRFSENYMQPAPLAGSVRNSGRLALDGSWELDFFGKHRAELDAALSRSKAAEYEAQAVKLALAANLSRAWVQLDREYASQDLLTATLKQRQRVAELSALRSKAGLDAVSDSKVATAGVATIRQEIEASKERLALLRNQIAALLGAGPERGEKLGRPQLASNAAVGIPSSLPAELVARRPDVAAQQARLDASVRDIDYAKTLFYPNINLVGFLGFQALGLDNVLEGGSRIVGVGPALRLPIFDGGRLRANLRVSQNDFDSGVAQYNALVIDAFREVADAATSQQAIVRQQKEQQLAEADLRDAYGIAEARYAKGLGNQLAVLVVEDRLLNQQRSGVELAARSRLAWIDLNRALGGGFRSQQDQTANNQQPAAR